MISTSGRTRLLVAAPTAALVAPNAFANTGLPLLVVVWPAAWLLFLPIVGAEMFVVRRVLGLAWARALRVATVANLASTLVAVPFTWAALMALSLVFDKGIPPDAALSYLFWLPPFEPADNYLVPLFSAFLCLPLFATSYYLEAWTTARLFRIDRGPAFAWALRANALSYGASATLALALALWSYLAQ
jgi:hypothetical protein